MLGPVLFLVLILDIGDNISDGTRVSSFADNTRASRGTDLSKNSVMSMRKVKTLRRRIS